MSDRIRLTALYVPANRPDRFDKAVRSGADVVILDLEDAVAPAAKESARASAARWLAERAAGEPDPAAPPVHVRINGPGSPCFQDDLAVVASCPASVGVRVPKVQSAADVATVVSAVGAERELTALIETALGVEQAYEIAAHPAVTAVCLGEADLASDLRTSAEVTLDYARSRIVVAARAARLPSPMMSTYTAIDDDLGLRASCHHGRALGFMGRTAIHPRQLRPIVEAFRPMPREIGVAQSILDAIGPAGSDGGVAVLPGGQMVDPAMLGGAREVLDREAAVVDALQRILRS